MTETAPNSANWPQVWLTSTVRSVSDEIPRFIRFHRAMGFARQVLFFDDPADPWLDFARSQADVTAIACNAAHWALTGGRPDIIDERQRANATAALAMARAGGGDWLAHFDSDELLLTDGRSIGTILASFPHDLARFPLREAIPPEGIAPHAFAAAWFRVNVPLDEMHRVPAELQIGGRWLRGHIASKVAVRTASVAQSMGVHSVDTPEMPAAPLAGTKLLHFNCITLERWIALWTRRLDGTGTTHYGGGHRWIQGHEAWEVLGDPQAEQAAYDRIHRLSPATLERLAAQGLVEQIDIDPALLGI
jgi:hypothetical protein